MAAKALAIMSLINVGRRDKGIPFHDESENIPRSTPSRHSLCLFCQSWFTDYPLAVRKNGKQDDYNWFTKSDSLPRTRHIATRKQDQGFIFKKMGKWVFRNKARVSSSKSNNMNPLMTSVSNYVCIQTKVGWEERCKRKSVFVYRIMHVFPKFSITLLI